MALGPLGGILGRLREVAGSTAESLALAAAIALIAGAEAVPIDPFLAPDSAGAADM